VFEILNPRRDRKDHVSRKYAKHVLSDVEGAAKNKTFEARNPKFETISNDQKKTPECSKQP
jgi:hypothetical protein